MGQMVDEDGIVWEVDDAGNPLRAVGRMGDQQPQQPQPFTLGRPNPIKPQQDAASLQGTVLNNQRIASQMQGDAASRQLAERKFAAELYEKGLRIGPNGAPEPIPGWTPPASIANRPVLTAKERADAIMQYRAAMDMDRQIKGLEDLYRQGPGSTSGIAGLKDYISTPANQTFDHYANQLRGPLKQALGMTGGENNTATEGQQNLGGYLPQSSDFDANILTKIDSLRQLQRESAAKAVAILGGVPDQNGNVTPIPVGGVTSAAGTQDINNPNQPFGGLPALPFSAPHDNGGGGGGTIATGNTVQEAVTIPPQMQAEHAAFLAAHPRGKLTADQYKAFRIALGMKYGFAGTVDPAATERYVRAYNDPRQSVGKSIPLSRATRRTTGMERARGKFLTTGTGAAIANAANMGGFGIPQALAGRDAFDAMHQAQPVASTVGDVIGAIAGTGGLAKVGESLSSRFAPQLLGGGAKANLARGLATDATYGGIYGGIAEGDPIGGAMSAAAGSAIGRGVGKGIQKTVQGVSNPAVQYLTERGVPLTLGQTLGNRGVTGRIANKLESLPVVGDMMARGRTNSLKEFERAALQDVVSPVGGVVTSGGGDGLAQAQDAIRAAANDAFSGINVRVDPQFVNEASQAIGNGRSIPKFGDEFSYSINREVAPLFGDSGQLSGPELQSGLQSLASIRSGFAKNPDQMATYAADATGQIEDALGGLVSRQAPDFMPKYDAFKGAYRRLVPFEQARIGAVNQEAITPAQLARAITTNTRNYGGRAAAARGDNLTPLIRAGQEVLPSTVPNSGTADRGLVSFALPAVLGGSSYALSDVSPGAAATLATLAALSTRAGQKATQSLLVKRPQSVRKAGSIFGRRKSQKAIGAAGSGLLLGDQ